jgi:hypothetical protein
MRPRIVHPQCDRTMTRGLQALSPKGQPHEAAHPLRAMARRPVAPGDCLAYTVRLAPVVVAVMMSTATADRHRHKDAGLSSNGHS